jgi:hypothetical protein
VRKSEPRIAQSADSGETSPLGGITQISQIFNREGAKDAESLET